MPSKKTVEAWGYDCLGYDCNAEGLVTKIWCKLCKEYSGLADIRSSKKGVSIIGKKELNLF